MPRPSVDAIRTVAVLGHSDSGKTTLAEALLHRAGAINTLGSVERGDTVCDFDPMECEYRHSLNSALCHLSHANADVQLIDTPGYPDFIGHAICALAAVETAMIVVNAQNGIELTTRRMMQWAAERGLDRIVVINKIDAERVDLPRLLSNLRDVFGRELLPVNLPAGEASRVVDCFFNPSGEADFSSVADAHQALVDQVVEVDEDLMARYLEQGEIAPEQLHAPLERAMREGHLVPVCFVSARSGAGVPELLDVLAKLAPSPLEGNPPLFVKADGEAEVAFPSVPDPDKHVLAHVFKVVMDPYVGKLGIFRVHQGTVTRDSLLFVGEGRKPFKVGHLFRLQGKRMDEVEALYPGEIGAVAKVDEIAFDVVLHDSHDEDHIYLRPLRFPEPMLGLAISAKRRGDEQRIAEALHKLQTEDACVKVEQHDGVHETVLRAMGELHLRYLLDRMANSFKLEVETRPPRIPYRETITQVAEGHYRHKKQSGGAGQFGEVYLRVAPLARGEGFRFVDDVYGGAIPGQFIAAVEKGVRAALQLGVLAGYPLEDIQVSVYDGKSHAVDGKDIAFQVAGRKAMLAAVMLARPVILEPVVAIEISCQDDKLGDLAADLTSRRGHVLGTETLSQGVSVIRGQVPLAELEGYAGRLKSITAGQGGYTLHLSHYDAVPQDVQQRLAAGYKAAIDED